METGTILPILKTHIPVYSPSLDKGLSTRKPIEWQRLTSQVEVQIRDYLSTGKYYQITGILPLRGLFMISCRDMIITSLGQPLDNWTILHH